MPSSATAASDVYLVRTVIVILASVVVGGCMTPRAPTVPSDSAPLSVPDWLVDLPDPVVRAEPRTIAGNKSPYTVLGKTYAVMPSSQGYRREGRASWYGTKFHGRSTSNGERYDMYKLTAAHKHLPIPTYVRVTNLDNSRSTVVRINDRGPFHSDRIIDLSFAAAVKLGFADNGTARVLVESLEPGAATANTVAARPRAPERYFLQLGGFATLAAADAISDVLGSIAQPPIRPTVMRVPRDEQFRVRMGPFATRAEAERMQALALMHDVPPPAVVED